MRAVVSAASVLAITAGASAAQFQFLSMQAGAGLEGVQGVGYTPTSGNFFKSAFNSTVLAGPFGFFGGFRELEFDSYFGIDANGPSSIAGRETDAFYGSGSYETNSGGTNPFALTIAPGSNFNNLAAPEIGVGVSPQPFLSGISPGGFDGVFVMRATVDDGEGVLGGGVFAVQGAGGTETASVNLDGTTAIFDGQEMRVFAYLTAQTEFGDTYDLWFEVPTPGTLALLGLGGLVTLRRRRS